MNFVVKTDNPEKFAFLLKSQLENCRKSLDIHQKRWDPKITSLCLTLYVRLRQAYVDIKKCIFVQLPSKCLLQCNKTSAKQFPGFIEANLILMKKEMDRQKVWHRWNDNSLWFIITKSGDTWNLVGFIDMDKTNNWL